MDIETELQYGYLIRQYGYLIRQYGYLIIWLKTELQAFNLVLRVAWVETVMKFNNIGMLESRMLDFLLASLEVIRRGHWNFYRYITTIYTLYLLE